MRGRWLSAGVVLAAMWLTAAELALRASGYASPLLFAADADYEYYPAPNQDTHRLDVRIRTNRFGMRSPDFDPATETRQRVLVLGDSVIHGGNWTDQDALATSRLTDDTRLMLNISAGSWGPGNMLAYLQRHGSYAAERAILVLSSHDWLDDRSFAPPHEYATPTRSPRLALARLVDQYVLQGPAREDARTQQPGREGDARRSLAALLDMLGHERACIVMHWTAHELANGADPEMRQILDLAAQRSVPVISADVFYRPAFQAGDDIYRDDIHPNDAGQQLLAEAMRACLVDAPVRPAPTPAPARP